jgi:predicted peptidase
MRRPLVAPWFGLVLAGLACAPLPQTGFLDRTVVVEGRDHPYQVYVPRGWTGQARLPVVLFLHGSGERGDNGLLQTEIGLPSAIRRAPERFPAIVVMPQCPRDRTWNEPGTMASALAALDRSLREFGGDPARVSLTGLSMGGYGTWYLAAHHPERFAALGVVCGGVHPPAMLRDVMPGHGFETTGDPYAWVAERVAQTPVWIFHGSDDAIVPVTESRRMVRALEDAGGNVRYTEYPGVGHDAWMHAYAEEEFVRWLIPRAPPRMAATRARDEALVFARPSRETSSAPSFRRPPRAVSAPTAWWRLPA